MLNALRKWLEKIAAKLTKPFQTYTPSVVQECDAITAPPAMEQSSTTSSNGRSGLTDEDRSAMEKAYVERFRNGQSRKIAQTGRSKPKSAATQPEAPRKRPVAPVPMGSSRTTRRTDNSTSSGYGQASEPTFHNNSYGGDDASSIRVEEPPYRGKGGTFDGGGASGDWAPAVTAVEAVREASTTNTDSSTSDTSSSDSSSSPSE